EAPQLLVSYSFSTPRRPRPGLQYVDRCVHITVGHEAAVGAQMRPYRERFLDVLPTPATPLRGIMWGYSFDVAPSFCRVVLQAEPQHAPPTITDRQGQRMLSHHVRRL